MPPPEGPVTAGRAVTPEPSVEDAFRVVACAAEGATRLEARPAAAPGPGELLLRLRWCGLCGTDLYKLRFATAPAGTVLGHEVVGTVEALGDGAPFAVGDLVVAPHHVACGACALCRRDAETLCPAFREEQLVPGGFSERVIVGARAAARAARRLPSGMAEEAAVFLEPAACVVRGVRRSGLPLADDGAPRVAAVVGGGSMGLLHLLVLRALAPGVRVALAEPLRERRDLAARLGADRVVAEARDLAAAAGALADGRGADAVFDCVGDPAALAAALAACREGGTVVLFAHAPAGAPGSFDWDALFKRERRIVGTYSGGLADQDLAWRLLESGRLDPRPLVTHRLPLSRFPEAVALCVERAALKVLLEPDPAS